MNQNPTSVVIPANSGESIWQPGVKGNCITIKVSPWNVDKTNHTVFLHELPKGGEVPEHSHEKNEEIFICLEGEGIITIEGKDHTFKKHDVAYLAPLDKHRIFNTNDNPLKFMVVISPTGLEDRLKQMGIVKKNSNECSPDSVDPTFGKTKTHGVI